MEIGEGYIVFPKSGGFPKIQNEIPLSGILFFQIPNVGIVLTDAVSNRDKERTIPEAELAHKQEINMFTVGFTSMNNNIHYFHY